MIQNLNKILAARMQNDPNFLVEAQKSQTKEEDSVSLDEISKTLELLYRYIKQTEEKRNLDLIEIKKTQSSILLLLQELKDNKNE